MDEYQKRRFQNLFNLQPKSFDTKGILLFKVLELDSNSCDDELELTYKDFLEFLYVEDIKTVEDGLNRLKRNLSKGKKYHYIHSYGKNGKSTFNRRFINESKSEYQSFVIDFQDFQINKSKQKHSFVTVLTKYYNLFSAYFKDEFIETLLESMNHIRKTQLEIKIDNIGGNLRNEYNSLFCTIDLEFISYLEGLKEQVQKISPDFSNKLQRLFSDSFKDFVDGEVEKKKSITIELLNLLILTILKLQQNTEKKIVFIFDNLDDVLTHSSEYLTAEVLPQIDTFFVILNKYINQKAHFIDNSIIESTSFIFTYRTANYVSSMHSIHNNPSAAARKENLLSSPLYVISSINATIEILKRKMDFYENLCSSFDIDKAPSFAVLSSILESIDNDDEEFKYLFKLWNGNQFAFVESFKSLAYTDFKHSILNNPELSLHIKRGAFLFFIVKYYMGNGDRNVMRSSTLSAAFQYAFTSADTDKIGTCNLLRLFLGYIINHNKTLNRNKIYTDNKDVFNRGVSFKKVLDAITVFKREDETVYNKEQFQVLFERIFHDDIDAFDYFITCSKNTVLKNGDEKLFGKKYNFKNELDIYFDNDKLTEEQESDLDSIRLYYNTNSRYFLRDIKRHFEFFSSILNENNHPLTYRIKIYNCAPEDDLFNDIKYQLKYNFNNESIIKSVFEKIKHTINTVTDFYIDSIIKIHPPRTYCDESYFALDEIFLYDDLISKHIAYLENVRWAILNRKIAFEIQDNKNTNFLTEPQPEDTQMALAHINARFIYWIEKYIHLFNSTYDYIKSEALKLDKETDNHSYKTRSSFRTLLTLTKEIKDSDFTNFSTRIVTKNEKAY